MTLPSFAVTGGEGLFDLLGNVASSEIVGNGLCAGTAPAPAQVTFTSNVPVNEFVTFADALYRVDPVVATVGSDGSLTRNGEPVRLLANDGGLSVTGLQWQATIGNMKPFWFDAPTDGGTVDLASVAPVPNVPIAGIDVAAQIAAAIATLPTGEAEYYTNLAAFPGTGNAALEYVAIDTGKIYRWSGSAYVELSAVGPTVDVQTHAATGKTTPVDADELPLADSAASFGLKKLTFANLKTFLATWLTTLTATWSNKTLSNPVIAGINDAAGRVLLFLGSNASAVNYVEIDNAATGTGPTIYAWGSDSNVDGILANRGTGVWHLTNPSITNYTEGVVAIGSAGSAQTISLASGTVQTATLTSATACTFTMPTAVAGKSWVLYLKQPSSGTATTATFTGVKWNAAGAPTITAATGKMDILSFVSDGTNWYGTYVQGFTY
jgi:hypothetical protein